MKVIKSNLERYFERRKENIENDFFTKKIKLSQMNYYRITYKDGDLIMNLYLDNNSNATIKFYRNNLTIPNLYESILGVLSESYESINIEADDTDVDTIKIIKEKSSILEETEEVFNDYIIKNYKIDLKQDYQINSDFNIKKLNYQEYLELREEEIKSESQYQEIKLGTTKYYELYDNDKNLIGTFVVVTNRKNNEIYLKEEIILIPGVLKAITKELVNDYDSIVFNTLNTSEQAIKCIKENIPNVEDITPDLVTNFGLINLKVNLKK